MNESDDDSDVEVNADKTVKLRRAIEVRPIHPIHCKGTLRDFVHCATTSGSKIINFLDNRVSPDKAVPPPGIATDSEAEQGTPAWKRFGLAATMWMIHPGHIDAQGLFTFVDVLNGLKLWVAAIPKKADDLGALESFGEAYRVDLRNSQDWRIVAVLLRPGDTLCVISSYL